MAAVPRFSSPGRSRYSSVPSLAAILVRLARHSHECRPVRLGSQVGQASDDCSHSHAIQNHLRAWPAAHPGVGLPRTRVPPVVRGFVDPISGRPFPADSSDSAPRSASARRPPHSLVGRSSVRLMLVRTSVRPSSERRRGRPPFSSSPLAPREVRFPLAEREDYVQCRKNFSRSKAVPRFSMWYIARPNLCARIARPRLLPCVVCNFVR